MLERLRKDVLISVYGFAGSLKRFTGPIRDLKKLNRAIALTYESQAGGSRIYEAIIQAARDASSGGGNDSRMMLALSRQSCSDGANRRLLPELRRRGAESAPSPGTPGR